MAVTLPPLPVFPRQGQSIDFLFRKWYSWSRFGGLSEWFMELVLKTSDGVIPTVSSNLTASANILQNVFILQDIFYLATFLSPHYSTI